MKKHFPLSPSITHIEQRLVGITDGLIEAVQRGETSPTIAKAVRSSPEWVQYQADATENLTLGEPAATESGPTPAIPAHIGDLIRRRVAAHALASTPLPAPGQIVSVEKIVTPRPGQLDGIMMAPLHVLLDSPAEVPALWHGWLVSAETDYAGWWDFVLQEEDAPFDPEAAMIQLWNPVRLYLPMVGRVVAALKPHRLQAVRMLAADFALADPPADVPAWPGRVASRVTSTGLSVVTGSPLDVDGDARRRYQQLYFDAAEAVREPARLALSAWAAIPANQMGALLNRLVVAAAKMAEVLLPEPRVAVAMSGQEVSSVPDLFWPGIARMRIDEYTAAGDGRMEITAVGIESLVVEVRKGSLVEERIDIAPGGVNTVAWDQGSTGLTLATTSGRKLELSLKDA